MTTSQPHKPYTGTTRQLVISLDVGTTYSGASYMILQPGQVPVKRSVMGFKGKNSLTSGKTPTVVLYDRDGRLKKCGAEAIKDYNPDGSDIEVQWFKLLLARSNSIGRPLPPVNIPRNLTVIDVLGHYLGFLNQNVRDAILKQVGGSKLWESLAPEAHYIISHPNGWEGAEQERIREAAIKGGLISNDADERDRIEFVTEGEASFHWCISDLPVPDGLKEGSTVVIADAGGGTIDVSSFQVISLNPLKVKELHAATCKLAGSVFVTHAFSTYIQEYLRTSNDFHYPATIEKIVEIFDDNHKCSFNGTDIFIEFGTYRDNDVLHNIRHGILTVPGEIVAGLFQDSVLAVTTAIGEHVKPDVPGTPGTHIFFVGGFAESPYLSQKVQDGFANLSFTKNDLHHMSKTVAEGGLSFYLESYVTERIAKYTIGIKVEKEFSWMRVSHLWRGFWYGRETNTVNGTKYLSEGFLSLVTKGDVIARGKEYEHPVYLTLGTKKEISIRQKIIKYTGPEGEIQFLDRNKPEFYKLLCTFTAGPIPSTALKEVSNGPQGRYYEFHGKFVVALGSTEVKCRLEWSESGKRRRSLATSVWIDDEQAGETEGEKGEEKVEQEAVVRLRS